MDMAKGWEYLVLNSVVILTSLFRSCQSCDPLYCVGKVHGSRHVDVYDPHHYYHCDYDRALYKLCAPPLVFDMNINNCNHADPAATTPTSIETSGVVVGGYCEVDTGDGTTQTMAGSTQTTTGTTTGTTQTTTGTASLTTIVSVTEKVNLYLKHPNMESSCTIHRTITVASCTTCAVTCRQTVGCTDFNFWSQANEIGSYSCHLLTCESSHMLTTSAQTDFYEWI